MARRVVDVLVPVAVNQAYSYRIPDGLDLKPGDVVAVPLGPREVTAVVWAENANPDPRLHNRLKDVSERLAPNFAAEGSRVELAIQSAAVKVDRFRLEQVVTNLLTNALKFGRGQPVDLEVSGTEAQVRISVRDHGIGIAPDDAARIFRPFERAVSERSFGGLGLGLWISQQFVEAMGGHIAVESTVGEGAKFIVTLPRHAEASAEGLTPPRQ